MKKRVRPIADSCHFVMNIRSDARVFATGEDTLVLRLTSKLVDLQTGYANRILWQATEPDPKRE